MKLHHRAEQELHGNESLPTDAPVPTFSIIPALDDAIEQFHPRHTVSGTEVVDLLLELRLVAELQESVVGGPGTAP